ncbi:hypothetical protein Tco_1185736 [Tanacetum coccineum]
MVKTEQTRTQDGKSTQETGDLIAKRQPQSTLGQQRKVKSQISKTNKKEQEKWFYTIHHLLPFIMRSKSRGKYKLRAWKADYVPAGHVIISADRYSEYAGLSHRRNSPKRLGKDAKGNTIVHPLVSLDEHVAVQRENKVRTLLLQALPEDHMPDFHHYDDARDIWLGWRLIAGMEEMDLKWQMAMLSLRINRFEKEAGQKMNYNNQQPARFDRRRYSAFKVTEVKTDEPKALVSVDSMENWSDHGAENKTGEVEKVYGMMARLHADNGGADVSNAADEFAMMGISPKGDPSTDNDIALNTVHKLKSVLKLLKALISLNTPWNWMAALSIQVANSS